MKITGEWISVEATQAVCRMLSSANHQVFFVGGCVRNALLDVEVSDIDLATDATPERVVALAEKSGLKSVPTGIEHGTVTVVSSGIPHEITTFREDVETFGRHAVVSFSKDVAEDARRRDFTVNALYAKPDGTVIDPLGGLPDLQARRIRFIEDPVQRIREDHLRILRFFRFHAWYGDPNEGLDAEGLAAVAELGDGVESLSQERVGAEISKLMAAPDPAPAVASMRQAGILHRVLPGANDNGLALLVHIERENGVDANALRRLALIGGDEIPDRLRLSRKQTKQLVLLREEIESLRGAAEISYRLGKECARDVLMLRAVLLEQPVQQTEFEIIETAANETFPLSASDLMPTLTGPALGQKLKELEQFWIDSGFRLNHEELIRMVRD